MESNVLRKSMKLTSSDLPLYQLQWISQRFGATDPITLHDIYASETDLFLTKPNIHSIFDPRKNDTGHNMSGYTDDV